MSKTIKTGYELSFVDFQRLLFDVDSRPSIARLLSNWFGYEIESVDNSIRITSPDEAEVDMLSLFEQIQNESSKQYDLYQTAMSLWR